MANGEAVTPVDIAVPDNATTTVVGASCGFHRSGDAFVSLI